MNNIQSKALCTKPLTWGRLRGRDSYCKRLHDSTTKLWRWNKRPEQESTRPEGTKITCLRFHPTYPHGHVNDLARFWFQEAPYIIVNSGISVVSCYTPRCIPLASLFTTLAWACNRRSCNVRDLLIMQ